MTAKEIANALCIHYLCRSNDKYVGAIPEFCYGWKESYHRADVLALHSNGMLTEIEVKVSWGGLSSG